MLKRLLPALAVVLAAGGAHAQSAPSQADAGDSDNRVVTNPDWATLPDGGDMASAYPALAASNGWSGRVRMRCRVALNGFLTRCAVVEETPEGVGFGVATLSLAPRFRLRPQTVDGRPVEGASVIIPVNWMTDRERIPTPAEIARATRNGSGGRRQGGMPGATRRAEGSVVRPNFVAAPSAADVEAAQPASEGVAVIRCAVRDDGALDDCVTVSTTPENRALGEAATSLGPRFRVDLTGAEGMQWNRLTADVPVAFTRTRPEYVARPTFGAVPTGGEIEAALRAIAEPAPEQTARAALDCLAGEGGALTDCRVTAAEPAAAGPALLSLASRFRVRPWSEDGYSTIGSRVRLPLRYVAD